MCSEKKDGTIVPFDKKYAAETFALIMKNEEQLIPPYQSFKKGEITEAEYLSNAHEELSAFFNDNAQPKRVLLVDQKMVGFIGFCQCREMNAEALLERYQSQGLTEQKILELYPSIKKTRAECPPYALIRGPVIDEAFRDNGYGRLLLQHILEQIKQVKQPLSSVCLDVHYENEIAKHLYESAGFIFSHKQNAIFLRYKKALNEK